jgi:pimeloyl-ACP methyl ester carboxylesterase
LEQAKLVRQVIQRFALKGQRLVLVGHDTGGAVAQLCALQETESVRGLVLINSAALTEPPSYFKTGFFSLRARLMLKHLSRLGSRKESPEHRLLMRDWANHARRASMVQAFHAWENTWPGPVERRRFREEVSKLRQPVLLLWGRRDPMSPFDHARELMRYLPDGYLFENEESGHWPCFEEPDWVELKIREFLFMLGATQSARRGA